MKWVKTYLDSMDENRTFSFMPVLVAAIVVYFQHSWVRGFFQDGYLYAAFGKNASDLGYWFISHLSNSTYNEFFQHSPFIFSLEGIFFRIFGATYTTARFYGAIFTLITLVVLFFWVKKNCGNKLAYLTGTIFVMIPPLIKKSRFPNMDTPLMLFILLSIVFYWGAFQKKKNINWILCGLFFGLSMLTKGPMAVFIPAAIFLHLLLTRRLKDLISFWPWLGIILGFAVFSIWPLSLLSIGKFEIFTTWFKSIFLYSIADSRGITEHTFFQCITFLVKYALPWFMLTIFSIWLSFTRKRDNAFLKINVALFLSVLVPVSLIKFKYSHYIMPLYPAMALLAAYPISFLAKGFIRGYSAVFRFAAITLALVFLVFPLTTNIRRDAEIFAALDVMKLMSQKPNAWGVVNGVYPFYSLANMNGWRDHSETFNMNGGVLEKWILDKDISQDIEMEKKLDLKRLRWIFLIPENTYNSLKNRLGRKFDSKLRKLMFFPKKNMVMAIERELYKEEDFFIYE